MERIRSFDLDDTPESPDPLALSYNSTKPSERRTPSRLCDRVLAPASNNVRRTENFFDTPNRRESSPSKSFVMHTGRSGGSSPWKIKVTVEAQPEDGSDAENGGTPTRKGRRQTITTKIPLKGGDDSSPVKRKPGRRKSDSLPSQRPKRDLTPARRKSGSRKSD